VSDQGGVGGSKLPCGHARGCASAATPRVVCFDRSVCARACERGGSRPNPVAECLSARARTRACQRVCVRGLQTVPQLKQLEPGAAATFTWSSHPPVNLTDRSIHRAAAFTGPPVKVPPGRTSRRPAPPRTDVPSGSRLGASSIECLALK
jgi:hypothetical protein